MTTSTTQELKEHRAKIKQARETAKQYIERLGNEFLQARRLEELPDPDPKEWANRMEKFVLGLEVLSTASMRPLFVVEGVPQLVREWLASPITDEPATDEDLNRYLAWLNLEKETRQ